MNILMISPSAPPKNSPESIQVGRYLYELDKKHRVRFVTTPVESGWVKEDSALLSDLTNTDILILKLPFHKMVTRILASRYLRRFSMPDKDFWLKSKENWLTKQLHHQPDLIYSRSLPVSSATLAFELKKNLSLPWVMHLSDPWSDNPYLTSEVLIKNLSDLEIKYFEAADAITVTTDGMAEFYRSKYHDFAEKISVSHNVMPDVLSELSNRNYCRKTLSLLYSGALYGQRRPTTILRALDILRKLDLSIFSHLEVKFLGNMTEEIRKEINDFNFPNVKILGWRNYSETLELQSTADIMVSFEPDGDHPIFKTFLPSKMLDYIASRKPVLAITPEDSESWKLCVRGYGWAIRPSDHKGLASLLSRLTEKFMLGDRSLLSINMLPPEDYAAPYCADKLSKLMDKLVNS